MPGQVGLFDSFDNLDQVSAEAIISWLKPIPQLTYIENYLANKILYPQTLPQTDYEMQIDLAILREVLRLDDNPFLNIALRKVMIPARFLQFVPTLEILTSVFIDAFLLNRQKGDLFEDLWTIVLTDNIYETVGSVLLPQFAGTGGVMSLSLLGKTYKIRQGILTVIPCTRERCEIAYKLQKGKVLGKTEDAIEVYGGKLGLIVDGRSG